MPLQKVSQMNYGCAEMISTSPERLQINIPSALVRIRRPMTPQMINAGILAAFFLCDPEEPGTLKLEWHDGHSIERPRHDSSMAMCCWQAGHAILISIGIL
jgi:hypothetical protein